VSIKIFDEHLATYNKYKSRFFKEAQKIFKLSLPNIVKVTDVFEANNTVYFVMNLIDGKSLSKYKKTMPEAQVRKYLEQILSALEHIHKMGILHLDIKPSNIMIDQNDNAILIDFGASKMYRDGNSLSRDTLAYSTSINEI